MTRPMLAIEAGEEWRWLERVRRTTVGGTWAELERSVKEQLEREILPEAAWSTLLAPVGGEHWSVVLPEDGGTLYLAPFADREAWARVRVTVSVEVLDGVL